MLFNKLKQDLQNIRRDINSDEVGRWAFGNYEDKKLDIAFVLGSPANQSALSELRTLFVNYLFDIDEQYEQFPFYKFVMICNKGFFNVIIYSLRSLRVELSHRDTLKDRLSYIMNVEIYKQFDVAQTAELALKFQSHACLEELWELKQRCESTAPNTPPIDVAQEFAKWIKEHCINSRVPRWKLEHIAPEFTHQYSQATRVQQFFVNFFYMFNTSAKSCVYKGFLYSGGKYLLNALKSGDFYKKIFFVNGSYQLALDSIVSLEQFVNTKKENLIEGLIQDLRDILEITKEHKIAQDPEELLEFLVKDDFEKKVLTLLWNDYKHQTVKTQHNSLNVLRKIKEYHMHNTYTNNTLLGELIATFAIQDNALNLDNLKLWSAIKHPQSINFTPDMIAQRWKNITQSTIDPSSKMVTFIAECLKQQDMKMQISVLDIALNLLKGNNIKIEINDDIGDLPKVLITLMRFDNINYDLNTVLSSATFHNQNQEPNLAKLLKALTPEQNKQLLVGLQPILKECYELQKNNSYTQEENSSQKEMCFMMILKNPKQNDQEELKDPNYQNIVVSRIILKHIKEIIKSLNCIEYDEIKDLKTEKYKSRLNNIKIQCTLIDFQFHPRIEAVKSFEFLLKGFIQEKELEKIDKLIEKCDESIQKNDLGRCDESIQKKELGRCDQSVERSDKVFAGMKEKLVRINELKTPHKNSTKPNEHTNKECSETNKSKAPYSTETPKSPNISVDQPKDSDSNTMAHNNVEKAPPTLVESPCLNSVASTTQLMEC